MDEDKSSKAQKFIAGFMKWIADVGGDNMLYRGLADESQKAEASLHRRLRGKSQFAPKEEFIRASEELVKQAKLRGYARAPAGELKDLQLMGRLQHYGAATCLIDFTRNPLVALWFACLQPNQKGDSADGKVVAVDTTKYQTVQLEDLKNHTLGYFMKSGFLWKWKPENLDNRVIAQHSEFIFGKPVVEPKPGNEIIIPFALKAEILQELAKNDISEEYLLSDFYGFAQINAHDRPYRYYSEGADYYATFAAQAAESGDHQGAIHWYGVAIMKDSGNPDWFKKRGNAKDESGEYEDAIADYDQALKINPQDAVAYYNRGNAKGQLDDFKGAIDDYDRALEINPQDADAYINRGIAKRKSGNPKGAIDDYDRALEINPQDADAYYNRGFAKDELREYKSAIADYDRAIELAPQDAATYNNRGVAKERWRDKDGAEAAYNYADAIADYDKAIKINPKYTLALRNRERAKKKLDDDSPNS